MRKYNPRCLECKTSIPESTHRFCSKKCRDKYNRRKLVKESKRGAEMAQNINQTKVVKGGFYALFGMDDEPGICSKCQNDFGPHMLISCEDPAGRLEKYCRRCYAKELAKPSDDDLVLNNPRESAAITGVALKIKNRCTRCGFKMRTDGGWCGWCIKDDGRIRLKLKEAHEG